MSVRAALHGILFSGILGPVLFAARTIMIRLTRLDAAKGDWRKVKFPPCAYVIEVE